MSTASHLPARQQLFVIEYLVDGNGQRAAIAAGYGVPGAAVAAHRLLSNDKVKAVLQAGQQAHAKRLMLKRDDMAAALFEAADMARSQRNPMALIASTRALIKLFGLDAPERVAVDVSSNAMLRFTRMSDAELTEFVAAAA
jgi:hypothetical protein